MALSAPVGTAMKESSAPFFAAFAVSFTACVTTMGASLDQEKLTQDRFI